MKKLKLALALFALSASTSYARTIDVHVNGMVCSFCGQGITKKFSAKPEVKKVDVSLKDKIVKLELNDEKTVSDEEIQKILTESGYQVEKIERK